VSRLLVVLVAVAMSLPLASGAAAQELRCTVGINRSQLQGDEYVFLDELREDVAEYMNNRAWTEDVFQERERIDCSVQIIFTLAEGLSSFRGEVIVRASRPIYGTAQPTTLLLINDDSWEFRYTRGQALVFDPDRYDSFVSVLDFYAYLILGYDYDSFSLLGGTPHFERARRVAELARANEAEGWVSEFGEDRSRFDLVRELLDPAFAALRRAHYTYHYEVLDHFLRRPQDQSWEVATQVIRDLHELFLQFNTRRFSTDVFFTSKFQEITALFLDAPTRSEAYALLSEMDPAHLSEYDRLVNGR
jgi:hypothetical protein